MSLALPKSDFPGGLLLGRCNPYGAETGGPRHVMGGLHGPASATLPDPTMPEAIRQGEWTCPYPAVVRVRMTCRCDHTGRVMDLCSWHDEASVHAEMVGGQLRKVRDIVKVRGHYEEIQRRQAGACIRCLYPGQHAEAYHSLLAWQGELAYLRDRGAWHSARADSVRDKITDIVAAFDRGNASGEIHRCPMRLIAVS